MAQVVDLPTVSRDPATGDVLVAPAVRRSNPEPKVAGQFENLAMTMPENDVRQIGAMVTEQITYDDSARSGWEDQATEAVELLGIGKESDPDDPDYDNSDTSDHPLLLTALTRFQSKALSALLPNPNRVCRTEPAIDLDMIEDEDERNKVREEIDAAGLRVEKYYAHMLFEKHPSYVEDTDLILYNCGLLGAGIRKVYNDPSRHTIKTMVERVPVQDLILSYDTNDWTCGRLTHRMTMSTPALIRGIRSGHYRAAQSLAGGGNPVVDSVTAAQDRVQGLTDAYMSTGSLHRVYEVHIDLFLESDLHPEGLARPYIVEVHAPSQEVLSIRRNWSPGDPDETRIERFVIYLFHPGTSAVRSLGLGALLSSSTRALRKAQRRGLDAGYLANHPSGFKLKGFDIRSDGTKVRPGEFQDIETSVQDIRMALMLHPFQGPNQGLQTLAEKMEANGRELGGIASIDFSQLMKAGIAAGPAMAAYEESTEFQTAVHRRLYDAHASELRLIHERNREMNGGRPLSFGTNGVLKQGDLLKVNIVPYMKPGQASRQRQILEAQAVMEVAGTAPDVVNRRRAVEDYLRALGKPDIEDYIIPDPTKNPPPAMDPASEYAAILGGKPVRAAPQQDHQAHIDAHAAQMRGVQTSQLPIEQGQAAMAAIAAHIAEHMGMETLVRVASMTGIPLEKLGKNLPPEVEAKVASSISKAIVQIETERAAAQAQPDPNASKIEAEKVKGQNDMAKLTVTQRHEKELEDLKHRHALELQKQKDAAAGEREEDDNDTALAIAKLKGTGSDAGAKATASAGAGATAKAGAING